MLRCAITDRHLFPGGQQAPSHAHPGSPSDPLSDPQCQALVEHTRRLSLAGVDLIQIREKDLSPASLEILARRILEVTRNPGHNRSPLPAPPKILLNGPPDIAARIGADGIHLPGSSSASSVGELTAARLAFHTAGLPPPLTSTSCHNVEQLLASALAGFDYLLFGPVFEKRVRGRLVAAGLGLDALRQAAHLLRTRHLTVPSLLALGGVTPANTVACIAAGADGVAAIRLFLEPDCP